MDQAFEPCVEAIGFQHGDSWFHPPLVEAFIRMFHSKQYPTKLHSIELWEGEELVAGEVGFVVGAAYASLSGFYHKSSAGTIQLCATAKLLEHHGFAYWDLGMEMPYKINLGASLIDRDLFLSRQETVRNQERALLCPRTNASEIIMNVFSHLYK